MIEVVSLLGPSYAGKSTLAIGLAEKLGNAGIAADIIKKDDAMRALGRQRYGAKDTSGGYSVLGAMRHGPIPSHELHAWMNERVHASRDAGRLAILEGGTRTRTAQAETLRGLDLDESSLRIFMMQLPFKEVLSRARQRRQEGGRYDDMLPLALVKLIGQYRGSRSADAPLPIDPDVMILDANHPPNVLVDIAFGEILTPQLGS